MKNLSSLIAVLLMTTALCVIGCSNAEMSLDPAMEKAKIDSLFQVQGEALKDSISQACETRLDAEVAAKADSIMNAGK